MKILIVSASLNPESRSRVMALAAAEEIRSLGHEADFKDLREVELPLCDGDVAYGHPNVAMMSKAVDEAAAVLLAVPVYNYDANAAAKNLIELTGQSWNDKVVGFLCAAGGQGSYMSIMGLAGSLMLDFRCLIVPRFVYATGEAFVDERLDSEKVKQRIAELCRRAVQLAEAVSRVDADESVKGGS